MDPDASDATPYHAFVFPSDVFEAHPVDEATVAFGFPTIPDDVPFAVRIPLEVLNPLTTPTWVPFR